MGPQTPESALAESLVTLRDAAVATRFAVAVPGADDAKRSAHGLVAQLDDYVLPRLRQLDAPLLAVVGGSTGAGKSTLVNSLVRTVVSPAGVLRPTTRSPVLVCHPDDAAWFSESHVLPGLSRTTGATGDHHTLHLAPSQALTAGLAFLDAPDIDSVVEANRDLAVQLLAAADLWLFVTTAARYADAVPWELLKLAQERGTALAMVLNRVPAGADHEVSGHLREMLREHGVKDPTLFVLPETTLEAGLLPEPVVGPLQVWFTGLAASAEQRAAVVRQTLDGALASVWPRASELADASDAQATAVQELRSAAHTAYASAVSRVSTGIADGALLRGEVLARWQEFVGTGDLLRALENRVGRMRDRLTAAISGRPPRAAQLKVALESGLSQLITSAAEQAAEEAAAAWRSRPAGVALLKESDEELGRSSRALAGEVERLVREWQGDVLEMVRTEGAAKRTAARLGAYGVNASGLVVMVAVFASTHFIPTGLEVAVAGGTTVLSQKLLEAIFGDQAVRRLAAKARADLISRVETTLGAEEARFAAVLEQVAADAEVPTRLRASAMVAEAARKRMVEAADRPVAPKAPAPEGPVDKSTPADAPAEPGTAAPAGAAPADTETAAPAGAAPADTETAATEEGPVPGLPKAGAPTETPAPAPGAAVKKPASAKPADGAKTAPAQKPTPAATAPRKEQEPDTKTAGPKAAGASAADAEVPDPKAADPKAAGPSAGDTKAPGLKATDPKADSKAADPKTAGPKTADPKTAGPKAAAQPSEAKSAPAKAAAQPARATPAPKTAAKPATKATSPKPAAGTKRPATSPASPATGGPANASAAKGGPANASPAAGSPANASQSAPAKPDVAPRAGQNPAEPASDAAEEANR